MKTHWISGAALILLACSAEPEATECDASQDADNDGMDDCAELACGSDAQDPEQQCYACGWDRNDPGNLQSAGSSEGDIIANLQLLDPCGEEVALWDFAEEYHILWMTATW